MAKKVSLKKELSKKVVNQAEDRNSQKINHTEKGILARASEREKMPSESLINTYQVINRGKVIVMTVDLTDLAKEYPEYEKLIKQCIVGLNSIIKPGQSDTTIYIHADGIRKFIEFLNSERNLSNSNVNNIADINIVVAKSFSNYLLSIYPLSSCRNRWYSTIKRIVERLKELYPIDPLVGQPFPWPVGPGRQEGYTEGYNAREMRELIEACISDVKDMIHFQEKY